MTPLTLPLLDGCFVFDNSSLEKFQSCPYEYELSSLRRRITADNRAGLNFGQCCHSILKERYVLHGSAKVDASFHSLTNSIIEKHFSDSPEPVGDFRNLGMATEWWSAYNKMYPREEFNILTLKNGDRFIERSFMRPFASIQDNKIRKWTGDIQHNPLEWSKAVKSVGEIPIFFSGRMDLGLSDTSGEWILDHKSAFQFGKSFNNEMLASPQFRGYAWEFKHYFGRMPKGYIINAFRIRPPTKEAIYDTSKLFRTSGPDPDFQRIVQHLSEDDINDWEQNTFGMLEEIMWHFSRGVFGKHKKNCVGKYGPCQFYTLCNEVVKEQRDSYLMSANFIDNTWSPLNIPKKKENT